MSREPGEPVPVRIVKVGPHAARPWLWASLAVVPIVVLVSGWGIGWIAIWYVIALGCLAGLRRRYDDGERYD
jgi:hypothetical protein